MATLELQNVGKVYAGGTRAVGDVNLTAEDGEFVVLVGPSGCGKSTLLRMIAGLESISEGVISIAGREVNKLEPAERDIAMVFQNYALYPHMSVRHNLAYGLKNRGTPRAEIDRRVDEAADILQITDYLDRKPRALSGGQRQRVAMGRAIVREPSVFLFDEPLSNLDAKLRVQMRLEIKSLQKRLGVTAVYVTHDQIEAMTMADKLVVLNGGQVEQIGTPLDVYRRPASAFVASFIGSPAMNLLQGGALQGLIEGATPDVIVGIRPEDLIPDPDGPLRFDLAHVEELGAQRLLYGKIAGQSATAIQVADLPIAAAPRYRVQPDRVHFFDITTGKRTDDHLAVSLR